MAIGRVPAIGLAERVIGLRRAATVRGKVAKVKLAAIGQARVAKVKLIGQAKAVARVQPAHGLREEVAIMRSEMSAPAVQQWRSPSAGVQAPAI